MADIQVHSCPGDLSALQSENNRSSLLPSPSPKKQHRSAYYPRRGTQVEESNTDPFYLERTLTDTTALDDLCKRGGQCDVQLCRGSNHQYFTLSTANNSKDLPYPNSVRREPPRPRSHAKGIKRSTLSVVELEHQISLQQTGPRKGLEKQPVHRNKDSFSSTHSETTPDLTPSSSFSSNYSSPMHPDSVGKSADRHISFEPQRIISDAGSHLYLTPRTPPPIRCQPAISARPPVPTTPPRGSRISPRPSNDSSETITTMQSDDHSHPSVRYNRLGKPLPTLPNIGRNAQKKHNAQNGNQRPQIEPSMISPPSLINPVTMEPHTSHFDQAFFIPANDCPSPVPSPGLASSSPLTRELTADSPNRDTGPKTAQSYNEQSVWESDSDSESVGPKSLSKKPIDKLRKVRSRVHLRIARSAPRLNAGGVPPLPPQPSSHPDGAPLEKFPSMPDHAPQQAPRQPPAPCLPGPPPKAQGRSSKDVYCPNAQGSLRLVAPSTTSLVPNDNIQSNPQTPSIGAEYDMVSSTAAAAFQAQSRRRQRGESPASSPAPTKPSPTPTLAPPPIQASTTPPKPSSNTSAPPQTKQPPKPPSKPPSPSQKRPTTSPASVPVAKPAVNDSEKLRTLCLEDRTENTIQNGLALGRRPFYRRFWESLRILSCHGDVAPKTTTTARMSF